MNTSGWAYSHKLFQWFICPEQWVLQRNFFLSCLVAGISLTNMWVGLFIADFHIITISASVERVVEKLPHCPLHLEGLNETESQSSLVRAGSSHTFPGWGLGSGQWNSVSHQPCSEWSLFLPSADIRLCLWVSWFWHLLDTRGLFIVFQFSLCVLREKYLIK